MCLLVASTQIVDGTLARAGWASLDMFLVLYHPNDVSKQGSFERITSEVSQGYYAQHLTAVIENAICQ